MTEVEHELAELMAVEIRDKDQTMDVSFAPLTVFQLTALLQLALRHPHVPPDLQHTADRFLLAVRAYFIDCPHVLDVIQRGDDPTQDRRC